MSLGPESKGRLDMNVVGNPDGKYSASVSADQYLEVLEAAYGIEYAKRIVAAVVNWETSLEKPPPELPFVGREIKRGETGSSFFPQTVLRDMTRPQERHRVTRYRFKRKHP